MSRCIECNKKISSWGSWDEGLPSKVPWFCGEICAGYCCMWTARNGFKTPDGALTELTIRHKEFGMPEDLKRIEKILDKINEKPE